MKRKNWIWGLFFIICAILLIINQLGFLGDITPLNIIFTLFSLAILIRSLIRLEAIGISFSLAFLVIIYSDYLGLESVSAWIILLAALFAGVGMSLLINPRIKQNTGHVHSGRAALTEEKQSDNYVYCETNVGSDIKYLRCSNLEEAHLECNLGSLKVFFDHVQLSPNGAVVQIHVAMGSMELYIPSNWKVINNVTASLGGIENRGIATGTDGPRIVLNGDVVLGGLTVHYM